MVQKTFLLFLKLLCIKLHVQIVKTKYYNINVGDYFKCFKMKTALQRFETQVKCVINYFQRGCSVLIAYIPLRNLQVRKFICMYTVLFIFLF